MRGFLFGLAALAALGVAGLAGGWFAVDRALDADGPTTEPQIVELAPGSSVGAIADKLEADGVVRSALLFKIAVKLQQAEQSVRAGEYEIPAGASVSDVVDILVDGRPVLHTVTIPEGVTTRQALAIIAADDTLDGEVTLDPGEGRLLPETYAHARGEKRDDLVRRMMDAQTEALDAAWDLRADDLPFNTRDEALILASIVEKETAVPSERRMVAAVFVNRLKKRMRLESDPTIIYGLTGGEPLGRGLRRSEIDRETPYNTYKIRGLPPTPIANPGLASIEATLNPADADVLYFVADGSGGHAFASTYQEHLKNVERWRAIERSRR
ncbi:MAG: endolytic transglycosylase MltG [Pseudomonadota bacterium]